MSAVRSALIVFAVFLAFAVYFYGPPVIPGMHNAATQECNKAVGGNFRSFRLDWVTGPGATPHWSCRDASRPTERALDLGWWVGPF